MIKNNTDLDNNKKNKRRTFLELIKNKYEIKDGRLYYKYERFHGKIEYKKIS